MRIIEQVGSSHHANNARDSNQPCGLLNIEKAPYVGRQVIALHVLGADYGGCGLLQGDPKAFTEYLAQYRNTICGRHPIAVLLNVRQRGSTWH